MSQTDKRLFQQVVAQLMRGERIELISRRLGEDLGIISRQLSDLRKRHGLASNNQLAMWHTRRLRRANPAKSLELRNKWQAALSELKANAQTTMSIVMPLFASDGDTRAKTLVRGHRSYVLVIEAVDIMYYGRGFAASGNKRLALTCWYIYAGLDVPDEGILAPE